MASVYYHLAPEQTQAVILEAPIEKGMPAAGAGKENPK
jgi:hypothetical protein